MEPFASFRFVRNSFVLLLDRHTLFAQIVRARASSARLSSTIPKLFLSILLKYFFLSIEFPTQLCMYAVCMYTLFGFLLLPNSFVTESLETYRKNGVNETAKSIAIENWEKKEKRNNNTEKKERKKMILMFRMQNLESTNSTTSHNNNGGINDESKKKKLFLHHSNISFSNKYGFYDVNNHVFHHRFTICRAPLFFYRSFMLQVSAPFSSSSFSHSFCRITAHTHTHTPSKRKMSVKWIIYNALSHMINWVSMLAWSSSASASSEQINGIRNWMTRHWYSAIIYQFLTAKS